MPISAFFDSKEQKWVLLSAVSAGLFGIYLLTDRLVKNRPALLQSRKKTTNSPPNTPQDLPSPAIYLERPYPLSEPLKKPENSKIFKICLTGGPCAGKTTSLSFLSQKLTEKGFKVFSVPEIPTITKQGGGMIIMGGLTQDNIMKFQQYLMKIQMKIEDYFTELAILSEQPSIILCDRGVCDPYAYMEEAVWRTILDGQGWNMLNLRDKRYDAVVHLVTAADGADKFYSLQNNEARYEDISTAKVIDKRTQLAWIGHPRLYIIDNSDKDFESKKNRVYRTVSGVVGLPLPDVIYRKYLLVDCKIPENLKVERFSMEVTFIRSESNDKEIKIKKRTQNGLSKYTYSEKSIINGERSAETQREINARNYMILIEQKDESRNSVFKERICFIWEHQSFVLDEISEDVGVVKVLKIDGIEKDYNLKFPPFCKVDREITGEKNFSNETFSRKKTIMVSVN